jgi:hypothetical protein
LIFSKVKEKYSNNVLNHDENAQDVTSNKLDDKTKSSLQSAASEDMITDNSISQTSVISNEANTNPTQQINSNEQTTESEQTLKGDSNTFNDISAAENHDDTEDDEESMGKKLNVLQVNHKSV